VPFVNPDGAEAGNYRDNAQGVNLNRVWDGQATPDHGPEVFLVKQAIAGWVDAGHRYDWYFDLHSTSGPEPHFAFYGGAEVAGEEYGARAEKFLALVNRFAP